jgi:hypothetical protein
VLNEATNSMRCPNWIPSSAWTDHLLGKQGWGLHPHPDYLDEVPVMSATVLGLEILLNEPCIDLRMASELVLSDVGATIQILRLIGREYGITSERPIRMEDCLAGLEVDCWFGALSSHTFSCDAEHSATTAIWKHCRLVALYAKAVAESIEDISPESAYLVGLLHEIEAISGVLSPSCNGAGSRERSALSAIEGSLPLFVLAAIRTLNHASPTSTWRFILTAAHQFADTLKDFDAAAARRMNLKQFDQSYVDGCLSAPVAISFHLPDLPGTAESAR